MDDYDGRYPQNLIIHKTRNRLDLIDFLMHKRIRLRL